MIDSMIFVQTLQLLEKQQFIAKLVQNRMQKLVQNRMQDKNIQQIKFDNCVFVIERKKEKMPSNESQNQWEKLFQHLNYCLLVLKKTMDQHGLQIFKRVQHDVEILQKYIKSIMKYNEKREKQIEKLVFEAKTKEQHIQMQNNKIKELNYIIRIKQEQIFKKQRVIQHLKYSKKIDASYVSSILINGNESILQRKMGGLDKRKTMAEQQDISDKFSLSQYSQHCEQQKQPKYFVEKQTAHTSTKSEIKIPTQKKQSFCYGTINEQEQNPYDRTTNTFIQNEQMHKTSSLIFVD